MSRTVQLHSCRTVVDIVGTVRAASSRRSLLGFLYAPAPLQRRSCMKASQISVLRRSSKCFIPRWNSIMGIRVDTRLSRLVSVHVLVCLACVCFSQCLLRRNLFVKCTPTGRLFLRLAVLERPCRQCSALGSYGHRN